MPPLSVLVVDDDPDNADMLGVLVGLWGHEVTVVRDGPAALASVQSRCPDAVLFDVGMPGMSGLELAARLRNGHCPRPPLLVAITGYADADMREKVLSAGAQYLVKPVAPEALRSLLEQLRFDQQTSTSL